MEKICLIIIIIFLSNGLHGQTEVRFHAIHQGESLIIDADMDEWNGTDTTIQQFRCYLSGFEFFLNGKAVYQQEESYHLIDFSKDGKQSILLNTPEAITYDEMVFNLGIDSTKSDSGISGGDLDPMHGMYWTWQSGYIFFKLEGQSKDCPSRNNEFQFHIGGFLYPFNANRKIRLKTQIKKTINIHINLDPLLENIDWNEQNHIMSPSTEAMELADFITTIFSIPNEKE